MRSLGTNNIRDRELNGKIKMTLNQSNIVRWLFVAIGFLLVGIGAGGICFRGVQPR